jgi:hypothetical protein
MVAVGAERGVVAQRRVALNANTIPAQAADCDEFLAAVLGVRIMTTHAAHLGRAPSEKEIAPLAGIDRAAAREGVFSRTALPRVRVAGEKYRVAPRANAVHAGFATGRRARNGSEGEIGALHAHDGTRVGVTRVLARAAVPGLTTNTHFHEMMVIELPARCTHGLGQEGADGSVRLGLIAQEGDLVGESSCEPVAIRYLQRPAA